MPEANLSGSILPNSSGCVAIAALSDGFQESLPFGALRVSDRKAALKSGPAQMSAGKPLDTPITFGREPGDFGVGDSLVCANFVSGCGRVTGSRSDGVDDRSMGGESLPSTPAMKEFKE